MIANNTWNMLRNPYAQWGIGFPPTFQPPPVFPIPQLTAAAPAHGHTQQTPNPNMPQLQATTPVTQVANNSTQLTTLTIDDNDIDNYISDENNVSANRKDIFNKMVKEQSDKKDDVFAQDF